MASGRRGRAVLGGCGGHPPSDSLLRELEALLDAGASKAVDEALQQRYRGIARVLLAQGPAVDHRIHQHRGIYLHLVQCAPLLVYEGVHDELQEGWAVEGAGRRAQRLARLVQRVEALGQGLRVLDELDELPLQHA